MSSGKVNRREYLKYLASFIAGAVVFGGGIAAYYASLPPKKEVVTQTVKTTVTGPTVTVTRTVTVTPTPTPTPTPAPPPFTPPPKPPKMTWNANTAEPGTVGYIAVAAIADLVTKTYPDVLTVLPISVGGATTTVKVWDRGEGHSCYNTLQHLWQVRVGAGPFDPKEYRMRRADEFWQVLWMYPLIYFGIIRATDADKIKSWSDFAGRPVFPTPPGYGSHEVFRAVFGKDGLNIIDKIDLKSMSVEAAADNLKLGVIDVCWAYCDPAALAKWVMDVDARVGVAVVPPTPEELRKGMAAGPWLSKYTVDPSKLFTSPAAKAAKPFETLAMPFGIAAGADVSDAHVYYFVKAVFEKREELGKTVATFTDFAKRGLEWNIEVFQHQSKPPISSPIHPGTALYLREKGYNPEALGILVGKRK
ncbi:MAG: TAXI family TRAP transporter solute-binding subunit [Nitrososphaerota archaeon]|nr:TAXI family TRAP transporter solute-binding subunit [Nitrososphaerota archaeon]